MFHKVNTCVRNFNDYSDYFENAIGLRQGVIMSRILFSIFLEDLDLSLQENNLSGIEIDDFILILLLFADDMVILAMTL